MSKLPAVVTFLACGVLLGAVISAEGRTLRVPEGYKSIQRAIDDAEEGDTVFVKNGVYRENISLADGLTLQGEDPDKTVLRGDRQHPVIKAANNTTITNLTVANGGTGILSENTNAVIQRTIIKQNAKSGIQCLISLPQICNNIIAGNEWTGIYCELVSYGMRTAIDHNVIADNGNSGIMLSNRSVVLVQNNLFMGNKEFGVFVTENSKRSRIIYNAFYDNRRAFNNYAIIDETNIAKDPQCPPLAQASFAELTGYDTPYRGMGKDGSTIGLVSDESLRRQVADSDNDGIDDVHDKCMEVAEDKDGFEDEDGCPDYDNDFDGLYDTQDKCPSVAEDFDGFQDTDGCPDSDNDKDGIADAVDKCPNNAETANGFKDEDGCPDEMPK
jgi:hypothetical protein